MFYFCRRLILWKPVLSHCVASQVARAGRFGTKGLAITFVSDENDAKILNDVQDRFEVNVAELPEEIDISSYSKLLLTHLSPLQGDSYHLCVLAEFKTFLM